MLMEGLDIVSSSKTVNAPLFTILGHKGLRVREMS